MSDRLHALVNHIRSREHGSALLVSLMIMVGLSMLGLGFVAISETESAIAVNERNNLEVQSAAEAGANMVIDWFQNPTWAENQGIMPTNSDTTYAAIKTTRTVGSYTGVYKPVSATLPVKLCDRPYKPQYPDRFYGDVDNADLIINHTTAATILDNFNSKLFGSAASTAEPRISEIRIYAPPITGATNVGGFYVGGTRYGVATIAVTATKSMGAGTPAASKTVRVVVGEFPTPVPAGPIQSGAGSVNYGGSSNIHWGIEQSATSINDTKPATMIPWANPYERMHIERGYDDVIWPIIPGSTYDDANYLNEIADKVFVDPWFGTRGTTTNAVTNPGYAYNRNEVSIQFGAFANQDDNVYPTKKKIIFPKVDFAFWRRVALQSRATPGVYYFKYNSTNQQFARLIAPTDTDTVAHWVNIKGTRGLLPGLFFFDSTTGGNPQGASAATRATLLTPSLNWQSSDVGSPFLMAGFIILNASEFRTTGFGTAAQDLYYNMPGEPFRDIGHRLWDTSTNNWKVDAFTVPIHYGASNGIFDCQDLNNNKRCDIVTVLKTGVNYYDAGTAASSGTKNIWVPKTWHQHIVGLTDCTIPPANWDGTNGLASDCSEPHEPFFNMIYPTSRSGSVKVGWEANNAQTQRAKTPTSGAATVPACNTTNPGPLINTGSVGVLPCTSNSYDLDGAAVQIPAALDGLMYIEGTYNTQGNADMYGAMLAADTVSGTGNIDFWFKEELARGTYLPPGAPRVLVYSMSTDQVE